MPKYFNDARLLLYPKSVLRPDELTPETISALFYSRIQNTICLVFDGFDRSCLGFVVHVTKKGDRYELQNITKEVELIVANESSLIEVIKHVSGSEYSKAAQAAFQQIRNDIGSSIRLDRFGTSD